MKATQHIFDTVSVIKIDEASIEIEEGSLVVTEKAPSSDFRLTDNAQIGVWLLSFTPKESIDLPKEAKLSFLVGDNFEETTLDIAKLKDGKTWSTMAHSKALLDAIRRFNNSKTS